MGQISWEADSHTANEQIPLLLCSLKVHDHDHKNPHIYQPEQDIPCCSRYVTDIIQVLSWASSIQYASSYYILIQYMSTQYRLVQSGKTASGSCSAGPRFVRACSATDLFIYLLSQLFFPMQYSEQNFECMSCFPVWNMCFTHLILLHLIIIIKLGESTNYEVPWYVIFILPHYFCFHRSKYPPSTSFWIVCSLCSSHRGGDFPSI
jgi:hypothetical protein